MADLGMIDDHTGCRTRHHNTPPVTLSWRGFSRCQHYWRSLTTLDQQCAIYLYLIIPGKAQYRTRHYNQAHPISNHKIRIYSVWITSRPRRPNRILCYRSTLCSGNIVYILNIESIGLNTLNAIQERSGVNRIDPVV